MKGGVRKKSYSIFVISNFFTFPLVGWYLGGIIPAIVGFVLALIIDRFFPTWEYDLSWKNIDIALKNIYLYGKNPCELCFIVENRKVYIYRDERGNAKELVRMSVRLPVKDWSFLFDDGDFHKLLKMFGGTGQYHDSRGPYCYGIFPRENVDGCKSVLKFIFEKSVGGLRPDIYAQSIVNSKKIIWIDHGE